MRSVSVTARATAAQRTRTHCEPLAGPLGVGRFSIRQKILKTRKSACWPGLVLLSGYPFVFLKHERLRGDAGWREGRDSWHGLCAGLG